MNAYQTKVAELEAKLETINRNPYKIVSTGQIETGTIFRLGSYQYKAAYRAEIEGQTGWMCYTGFGFKRAMFANDIDILERGVFNAR